MNAISELWTALRNFAKAVNRWSNLSNAAADRVEQNLGLPAHGEEPLQMITAPEPKAVGGKKGR